MGLASLHLTGLLKITDQGVQTLLSNNSLRSLTHLDFTSTKIRSAAFAAIPPSCNLRSLRMHRMVTMTSLQLQLPASVPLEDLSLVSCRQLRRVTVSGQRLRRINLSDCPQLHVLDLRCPLLSQLLMTNCADLTTVLCGEQDVVDEALRAQLAHPEDPPSHFVTYFGELEELNAFGCRQLEDAAIAGLLTFAQRLRALNLNGCKAVESLRVASTCLESVDLSGAANLRRVAIPSPVLKSFKAVNCARLLDIELYSRVLTLLDVTNCASLRFVNAHALVAEVKERRAAAEHAASRGFELGSAAGGEPCAVLRKGVAEEAKAALMLLEL